MFSTARYFIKTAIVFLIVGLIVGLFMISSKYLFEYAYPYGLISAHTHIILVGFVMMMIMGVAIWFFPRAEKSDNKYKPNLILLLYGFITISTAVRFTAEVIFAYMNDQFSKILIVISSAGQVFSFILFFYSIWGRIRSVGSHLREAKGEKF